MYLKVQHVEFVFISMMLFVLSTSQVYAITNVVDENGISNKIIHKVSENAYAFQFEYCATAHNQSALGVIVLSDTEKIPLQIDPNIKIDECHQYGTQIRAFSDSSLETSIFYEKDIEKWGKEFDRKKTNLEEDLVHYHQKLLRLEDPNIDEDNSEEINEIKERIAIINHVIQSYKQGLKTFSSLK